MFHLNTFRYTFFISDKSIAYSSLLQSSILAAISFSPVFSAAATPLLNSATLVVYYVKSKLPAFIYGIRSLPTSPAGLRSTVGYRFLLMFKCGETAFSLAATRFLRFSKRLLDRGARIRFSFMLISSNSGLISGYCNCGLFDSGYRVFDGTEDKDVVSWTAMIDGFVRNGSASEAIAYFVEMKKTGIAANEITVVSVLSAAAKTGDVRFGRSIHGFYLETGRVKCDVFIGSSLVDMYGKCGCYDDAQKVFDEMPSKNVVTWSALIAGYVQSRCFDRGLFVFQEMLESDVTPNEKTLSSVLSACAHVGALHQGRRVHCYMIKNSIEINTTMGTTLIDLYAKCGCLEEARLVFERLHEKNVYSWTAMINGLAAHGYARGAFDHFKTMLRSHVSPNEVTFLAVLSACAHGGLVEEGRKLFLSMKERFNLEPNVDHYACMVDLLGRKGLLEEAKALIERMPMEPTNAVWGALFGACLIHKDYELGKYAASHVIKLQPSHYTLLANLYSESQNWNEVARVRKQMKDQQMVKSPGCSWIEVKGKLHEFIAFDTNKRCESDDLYKTLDNVGMQMRLPDELEDLNLTTLL